MLVTNLKVLHKINIKRYLTVIFSIFLFSCISKEGKKQSVDSITFDVTKDNPDFQLCNDYTYQYFNDSKGLLYKGDKPAIDKAFLENYNEDIVAQESGLVRIRFVVNCKGEADRYRLLGMDNNYNQKTFNRNITDQLLSITKGLKGWGVKKIRGKNIDYYQYLIFVLKDGKITKILP